MDTTELQRPGAWRFDRLDALPDDGRRYEVVDGLLLVSPPPGFWHQAVIAARCASCPHRRRATGASWPGSASRSGPMDASPT